MKEQERKQELFKVAQFCRGRLNQLEDEYNHFKLLAELVSRELERLDK